MSQKYVQSARRPSLNAREGISLCYASLSTPHSLFGPHPRPFCSCQARKSRNVAVGGRSPRAIRLRSLAMSPLRLLRRFVFLVPSPGGTLRPSSGTASWSCGLEVASPVGVGCIVNCLTFKSSSATPSLNSVSASPTSPTALSTLVKDELTMMDSLMVSSCTFEALMLVTVAGLCESAIWSLTASKGGFPICLTLRRGSSNRYWFVYVMMFVRYQFGLVLIRRSIFSCLTG